MKLRHELAAGAGLLSLFLALVLGSLRHHSPTVDEFAHLPAGYYYLRTGDFSLYSKNPPLVKLIAAVPWLWLKPAWEAEVSNEHPAWRPWEYGAAIMRLNAARYQSLFDWGRVMTVGLALLLGLGVWGWSRRRYGPVGGLLSLTCFCLCPNFLAHAGLATVDVGASLFFFGAVWAGLRFIERPGLGRAALAGVLLGLAQLAKFTSLLLIPLLLLSPLFAWRWPRRSAEEFSRPFSWTRFGPGLACLCLAAWAVLLAGYRFEWDPSAFARLGFHSWALQTAQRLLPWLPSPAPTDYLLGLDSQLRAAEHGDFPNYLFGHWYREPKWYYFLVALAVKTPIPILLGFLGALCLPRGAAPKGRAGAPAEAGLLIVMAFVFAGLTLQSRLQIGIRYLLPLYPLAYLLIGRLGTLHFSGGKARWYRASLAVLGIWLLVGTLRIYPSYLAYFNELFGGPANGYHVLLDSNLDWGQDLPGLAAYLKQHQIAAVHLAYFGHADPALYGINYDILQSAGQPGLTAISAAYLMGFPYPVTYTTPWSKIPLEVTASYQSRRPVAVIGYSIFLFQD